MTTDRILPSNTDMEASLLSALLIDNRGFDHTGDLAPDDFYNPKHAIIYRAMQRLISDKQPVDLVTVAERLGKMKDLKKAGGASYLATIADAAPIAVNAGAYAKGIKDLAMVRGAILSCMRIIDAGYTTTDPEQFVDHAQETILALQTTGTKDRFMSMDELMIDSFQRIEQAQTGDHDPGLDFGFPVLGRAMHIAGSKLCIIAARPAMGKTALMLSIAKRLAYMGVKSAILSLEMDKEALADRFVAEESDVNALCFYARASIGRDSMNAIEDAAGRLSHLPILIDDAGCQIQDVVRKCRKARKLGAKIIFIDQLSKISFPSNMTDFQGYTRNCNRIAELKKELRIPIVLLCQLNRQVEERTTKKPRLSDLKQTGAIEEDADIVLLLYRPGYYAHMEDPHSGADQSEVEIILAKNRNGAVGVETGVRFNAKRGMFVLGT